MTGLLVILSRVLFKLSLSDPFNSQHDLLWRCPKARLICILQHFIDFTSVILHSFFTRFELQNGAKIRLNLVGLGGIMAHVKVMFALC